MSYQQSYNDGMLAFSSGALKYDNPISPRTAANSRCAWDHGWDNASSISCKGLECNSIDGTNHSDKCILEHENAYK